MVLVIDHICLFCQDSYIVIIPADVIYPLCFECGKVLDGNRV